MVAKQEVALITSYINAICLIFPYVGLNGWRVQWRHLFYDSGIQYGHQTGSGIDFNLYLSKSTNLSTL